MYMTHSFSCGLTRCFLLIPTLLLAKFQMLSLLGVVLLLFLLQTTPSVDQSLGLWSSGLHLKLLCKYSAVTHASILWISDIVPGTFLHFSLANNSMTGSLPVEVGSWTNLAFFDIALNQVGKNLHQRGALLEIFVASWSSC